MPRLNRLDTGSAWERGWLVGLRPLFKFRLLGWLSLIWIMFCALTVEIEGAGLGEGCSQDSECTGYTGAACLTDLASPTCGCDSNTHVPVTGGCSAVYGEACDSSIQSPCNTPNANCSTTCQCPSTHYYDGNENRCEEKKDCSTPSFTGMTVTSSMGTKYQDTATLTCSTGYNGNGQSGGITCEAGGTWSTPSLTCTKQDCGTPSFPGMTVSGSSGTEYEDTATLTCSTGYNSNGQSGGTTCGSGGTWSTPSLTCTIKDCGTPSFPGMTVSASTGTEYEDTATLTCITGYNSNGQSGRITCGAGGTWSTPSLTCTIKDCGTPSFTGMTVSSSTGTKYQDTATLTCSTGYNSNGQSRGITCGAGGTWSTLSLTCTKQDCGTPSFPGMTVSTSTGTKYQDTATLACSTGYNSNGQSGEITCGVGTWATPSLTCTKLSHGATCHDTLYCDDSLRLSCTDSAGSKKCACSITDYWDSSECLTRPSNDGTCSTSSANPIPCKAEVGLTCTGQVCSCLNTHYWSTSCQPKKVHSETCNSNEPCRTDLGLSCNGGTCLCTGLSSQFWDNSISIPRCKDDSLFRDSCLSGLDDECESNSVCSTQKLCACPTTTPMFWHSSDKQCQAKKLYGESCPPSENNPCESNAKCPSGLCNCVQGSFWKVETRTCETAGGNNADCYGQDEACKSGTGLRCIDNKCQCTAGNFWEEKNMMCETKKSYGEACPSGQPNECQYNLLCPVSGTGTCGCGGSDFWRKTENQCQTKITYNGPCYVYSENSEILSCGDADTVCTQYSDSDKRCRCKVGYFRNTDTNNCEQMLNLKATDVSISGIRETELDVTWTEPDLNKFVSSYIIHWSPSNSNVHTSVNVGKLITKTITDLKQGETYTVWVVSEETASRPLPAQTVTSDSAQQQTKPGRPGAVTTPDSNFIAPSVALTWKESPGLVDNYDITLTELDRNKINLTIPVQESVTSSTNNATIPNLKHGHWYEVTLTATKGSLVSEKHEENIKTVSKQPNPPTNVECTDLMDKSIGLRWQEPAIPNGYIQSYRVVTSLSSSSSQVHENNTGNYATTFTVDNLKPATYYMFTVAAENDNSPPGNIGPPSSAQYCRTSDARSEPPVDVSILTVTSRAIEVSWRRPLNTYGDLRRYTILVKDDSNNCLQRIVFKCDGCADLPGNKQDEWKALCKDGTAANTKNVTIDDLNNSTKKFNYIVAELNPYANYTFLVFGSNQAGKGNAEQVPQATKQEVPGTPYNIQASNIGKTSLTLSWKLDGPRPGVTGYTVTVTEIFGGLKTTIDTVTVNGFDNKQTVIEDLEEFVMYEFSVTASTSAGSSSAGKSTGEIKTLPGPTGKVKSLNVKRPSNSYRSMDVTWENPDPKDINGELQNYVVLYSHAGSDQPIDTKNIDPKEGGIYQQSFDVFPELSYTVQVWGVNEGNLVGAKEEQDYTAPAGKPPIIKAQDKDLFEQYNPITTTSTLSVHFDLFDTDNTNGNITDSGLIACVKCDEGEAVEVSMKRTWAESKSEGHTPYRATNGTWKDNRKSQSSRTRREAPEYYYVIGEDTSCEKREKDVFCNGPLPAGSEIQVRVFVCTNGGCSGSKYYGPFKTEAEPDDSTPLGPIIGGVVAVVVAVLVVVIIICVLRKRKKEKLNCCQKENLYERTFMRNTQSSDYAALDLGNQDAGSRGNERPPPPLSQTTANFQNRGFDDSAEGDPSQSDVECQYEVIADSARNGAEGVGRSEKSRKENEIRDLKNHLGELKMKKQQLREEKKKVKEEEKHEKKKANIQKEIQKLEKELEKM